MSNPRLLSETKKEAINELGISNYTEINSTVIQIEGKNYLILTEEEKSSFEEQILFSQLSKCDLSFLMIYAPNDIVEEEIENILYKTLNEVKDEFSRNRIIQSLINYEAYIKDMLSPVTEDDGTILGAVDIIPTEGTPLECTVNDTNVILIKVPENKLEVKSENSETEDKEEI